jgi:putative oxidoreductase
MRRASLIVANTTLSGIKIPGGDVMSGSTMSAPQLLGRALMAVIFILGGWGKLSHMGPFTAHLADLGVPMPALTYYGVVAIELLGGLAILFGFWTSVTAFLLAVYCVATAVLAHYHPGDVGQMTNFYKNLAMAGGFLQLMVLGAGAWSLDAKLSRR